MFRLMIGIDGDDFIYDTKETKEEILQSKEKYDKMIKENNTGAYTYIEECL